MRLRLPLRRVLRAVAAMALVGGAVGAVAAVGLAIWLWPQWLAVRADAHAMIDAHRSHAVSHVGWSFPARVWSDSASLDLPRARLVPEALARGYRPACPPASPGEVCPETGDVLLRGGLFPEGRQPAGNEGWTRPLALEPLRIGTLLGPDGEWREHLPLDEAPPHLIAAIIAAEDQDFHAHPGVNPRGLLRAAWVNLAGGEVRQGGSTLTMQVARNLGQDRRREVGRKLREGLTAIALEAHIGKDGVLQAYLDTPYLGQDGPRSVCGFEAAAQYYWGVPARELDLNQAATLAAILPAPGAYAPDRHPDVARARRDRVLTQMEAAGWDPAAVAAARAAPIDAAPHPLPADRYAPYLQATRTALLAALPAETVTGAGLDVWTALDPWLQDVGDGLFPDKVDFLERNLGWRGPPPLLAAAALLDVERGALIAVHDTSMASATDFNRATQARRQAGSSIKPLVYALALSELGPDGLPKRSAASTVSNQPHTFPGTNGWRPLNVGGDDSPTSSLAMGLSWSRNVAAASLLEEAGGPQALVAFANRLGFDTRTWKAELGLALGQGEVNPLEMSRLVGTVARGGRLASASPILAAVDPAGQARIAPPGPGEQVIPVESAAILRDLMRLVMSYGTGHTAKGVGGQPGWTGPALGKTGTSDDERDLWFTGATPHYAGALWVGADVPTRVGGTAGDLAAPVWGWWMRALHPGLPDGEFAGPVLDKKGICTNSGRYPNATCRIIGASFLPGTGPQGACTEDHPPKPVDAKPFENLWQRKERLAAERAAAAGEPGPTGGSGALGG